MSRVMNVRLIAGREFTERGRSRTFLNSNAFIIPVILAAVAVVTIALLVPLTAQLPRGSAAYREGQPSRGDALRPQRALGTAHWCASAGSPQLVMRGS